MRTPVIGNTAPRSKTFREVLRSATPEQWVLAATRSPRGMAMVAEDSTWTTSEQRQLVQLGDKPDTAWREKREILRAAEQAGFSQQDGLRVWKKLRTWWHDEQQKTWSDVLPEPIVDWASKQLLAHSTGLGCIDNARVANKRKSSQVRRYKRQRANGCCGFCDTEAVCPIDGAIYLLGFNYGH